MSLNRTATWSLGKELKTTSDLPPALVSLAVPGLRTLGVTEVLLMARHRLLVAPAAARLLHLLQDDSGTATAAATRLCV